jgi:hypothetical protein
MKDIDERMEEKHMNTRFNLITLAVILGLAALLFASAGITGAAAKAAIPGDALYPVKMTLEQTRLSLASDAGDRAQMKMTFAEQRLNEIAALIEEGRYREINDAVLSFESGINGAILELDTLAEVDPARAARLAKEITSTLTRYAQTLSVLVASAPEDVRSEVNRALTSTNTASSLDMPDDRLDDNNPTNGNDNDDDNSNAMGNSNDNDDDNSNAIGNSNDNDDDNSTAIGNSNDNDDDNSTAIGNSNDNDDDNSTAIGNTNDNGDDNSSDDSGNENSDDNGGNDNGSDDSGNDNGDDNGGNDNGSDDSGNDNGDDKGGKSDD